MRPYAEVVGDPVAHSKSPELHRFWLEALGIDADYRACRVARNELHDYFESRRADPAWRGCNLTAPHKESAIRFLDELSPNAKAIGAVNIVKKRNGRLIGDNSDIDGIAEALPKEAVADKAIVILGGGGAARAAIHSLAGRGARDICVLVRRPLASSALASIETRSTRIGVHSIDDPAIFAIADVLINASPLGMAQAPMPQQLIDAIDKVRPAGLVFDMVYQPPVTALLAKARSCSLATADGLAMLIGQARRSFFQFFGAEPPHGLDGQLRARLAPGRIRPIVLVGMPGAGKTTVGRLLAEQLDISFTDSDEEIERRTGLTIAEIFEQRGEAEFRAIEREVCKALIDARPGVIALGGGAFVDSETRAAVRELCTSIWLDAPIETLASRLKGKTDRPLLMGKRPLNLLQSLAEARAPSYAEADFKVASAGPAGITAQIIRQALPVLNTRTLAGDDAPRTANAQRWSF